MSPNAVAAPITSTHRIADGDAVVQRGHSGRLLIDHLVQALHVQAWSGVGRRAW